MKDSIDGSIHNRDNRYRWGGKTSLLAAPWGTQYDDWDTLIDGSNSGEGLCGYSDWRMPGVEELRSIVNYGLTSLDNSLETSYFQPVGEFYSGAHWSASPHSSRVDDAWAFELSSILSSHGTSAISHPRTRSLHVLLVRGGY